MIYQEKRERFVKVEEFYGQLWTKKRTHKLPFANLPTTLANRRTSSRMTTTSGDIKHN
jgi:hypothetical protein